MQLTHFKTTSPQGDGNIGDFIFNKWSNAYFKTTSPQGDGNIRVYSTLYLFGTLFQNHIPARGRKQVLYDVHDKDLLRFQNHIPARGRKPALNILSMLFEIISKPHPRKGTETHIYRGSYNNQPIKFQNHIPARGRKPYPTSLPSPQVPANFKTTSPQGDGNLFTNTINVVFSIISKPHPRKGTETCFS